MFFVGLLVNPKADISTKKASIYDHRSSPQLSYAAAYRMTVLLVVIHAGQVGRSRLAASKKDKTKPGGLHSPCVGFLRTGIQSHELLPRPRVSELANETYQWAEYRSHLAIFGGCIIVGGGVPVAREPHLGEEGVDMRNAVCGRVT